MQNDQVETLLKEYDARRAEINIANTQYRQTVGLSYLYLPAIVTATGIFSSPTSSPLLGSSVKHPQLLWLFVLSLAFLMGVALFAHALDSLSMILLMGCRCAQIEQEINTRLGSAVLQWDSRIAPAWFSNSFSRKGFWIKPQVLLAFWMFLFISASHVFLCFMAYALTRDFATIFSIVVLIITMFNFMQWRATLSAGTAEMKRIIDDNDEVTTKAVGMPRSPLPSLGHVLRGTWPLAVVSLLLGPVPMLIAALRTNSFWLSSPHPFPFLNIPTVFLGDSITLPLFNLYAFSLWRDSSDQFRRGKGFWTFVLLAMILALAGNFWIHRQWASDQYTGFMDLAVGHLSFAGWWHLLYSAIETTVVFIYLRLWAGAAVSTGRSEFAREGWRLFVVYSAIGIADIFLHWQTVFRRMHILEVVKMDYMNLIKLLLAILVGAYFRWLSSRRTAHHDSELAEAPKESVTTI
jgi:hypothetical protein